MESYKKHFGHDFHNYRFLSYVAARRPQLYFELGMQHIDHVKVGRQTTKSLLRLNKDEALKNEKTVLARLNNSVVARQVQEEHLHKYLPQKLSSPTLLEFLKKFPHKKRMSILSVVFQKMYNDNILNNLGLFGNSLAAVFPKNVRKTWAQLRFEQTNDFALIIHFESQDGFRLIKKQIEVTADKGTRCDLLGYLIEMCHANKDYHCYEKVLRYIGTRHRNEESFIRHRILQKIAELIDDDLTTDGFWDAAKDLAQLALVKGDSPSELLAKHLIYLYDRKLPIEEDLTLFISDTHTEWNHFDRQPVIKRHILDKSLELVVAGGILQDKQPELLKILFREVVDFNTKHPDQRIELNKCPTAITCIRQLIRDEDSQSFQLWMQYNNSCHWNAETILKVMSLKGPHRRQGLPKGR